ncbi:MAG: hypothetical protein ACK5VW_05365 [Holosporales bacterium]
MLTSRQTRSTISRHLREVSIVDQSFVCNHPSPAPRSLLSDKKHVMAFLQTFPRLKDLKLIYVADAHSLLFTSTTFLDQLGKMNELRSLHWYLSTITMDLSVCLSGALPHLTTVETLSLLDEEFRSRPLKSPSKVPLPLARWSPNLRRLEISSAFLYDQDMQTALFQAPKLEHLTLHLNTPHNAIMVRHLLLGLTNLKALNLRRMSRRDTEILDFPEMPNLLHELDVLVNESDHLRSLSRLTQLESLAVHLTNTPSDLSIQKLCDYTAGIPQLQSLAVEGQLISWELAELPKHHPHLESLRFFQSRRARDLIQHPLVGNQDALDRDALTALGLFTNLRDLELRGCGLSPETLPLLSSLTSLHTLSVDGWCVPLLAKIKRGQGKQDRDNHLAHVIVNLDKDWDLHPLTKLAELFLESNYRFHNSDPSQISITFWSPWSPKDWQWDEIISSTVQDENDVDYDALGMGQPHVFMLKPLSQIEQLDAILAGQ